MTIIEPLIFRQYPEIEVGFSTKISAYIKAPYYFNTSYNVGDEETVVKQNRMIFFNYLSLSNDNIAYQEQQHGDTVTYVNKGGNCGQSDAIITDRFNLGLAISTADCAAIFIYDKKNKVIAGVHSGWRGTEKKILLKTLIKLSANFNSLSEDITAYLAPSISQLNYEVGEEVASLFSSKYLILRNGKYLLDVAGANLDMLIEFGIERRNIQVSSLCSYQMKCLLHSYRRDGLKSGRSLGVIAMKDRNAK